MKILKSTLPTSRRFQQCREKDPEGFQVIFPEIDELKEDMEILPNDNPEFNYDIFL
jgi:hypothetical protein